MRAWTCCLRHFWVSFIRNKRILNLQIGSLNHRNEKDKLMHASKTQILTNVKSALKKFLIFGMSTLTFVLAVDVAHAYCIAVWCALQMSVMICLNKISVDFRVSGPREKPLCSIWHRYRCTRTRATSYFVAPCSFVDTKRIRLFVNL
jgi:hypothetical protein